MSDENLTITITPDIAAFSRAMDTMVETFKRAAREIVAFGAAMGEHDTPKRSRMHAMYHARTRRRNRRRG